MPGVTFFERDSRNPNKKRVFGRVVGADAAQIVAAAKDRGLLFGPVTSASGGWLDAEVVGYMKPGSKPVLTNAGAPYPLETAA